MNNFKAGYRAFWNGLNNPKGTSLFYVLGYMIIPLLTWMLADFTLAVIEFIATKYAAR